MLRLLLAERLMLTLELPVTLLLSVTEPAFVRVKVVPALALNPVRLPLLLMLILPVPAAAERLPESAVVTVMLPPAEPKVKASEVTVPAPVMLPAPD